MRTIKEILRLRYALQLSYRDIAWAVGAGYGTVVDYLERAEWAGLSWPIEPNLGERELARLLFPTSARGQTRFVEPNHAEIHVELRRKGVTS